MAFLQAQGAIEPEEMARTFNCGVGMIAIVGADDVEAVNDVLAANGETVTHLGEVIPAQGEQRVVYNGHLDLSR
jgi:phosphoribosylformylglycinamidine cyclo-ligase